MSEDGGWTAPGPSGPDAVSHQAVPGAETGEPRWVTWVVDDRYGARVAGAALRLQWFVFGEIALVSGVAGIFVRGGEVLGAVAGVCVGAVFVVLVMLFTRYQTRRRIDRILPLGSVLAACLTPDELWVSGPQGTSQVRYGAYDSVRVLGDIVVLHLRAGISTIYPMELFGPVGLARLRELVAAAPKARS